MSDTNGGSQDDQSDRDKPPRDISVWEWAVAALGAVLVVACVSMIVYEAFSGTGRPPVLIVGIEDVAAVEGGYRATIEIQNDGGQTAANVVVQGKMQLGGSSPELSEVTIDYVPAHSRRKAGLFFTRDPRTNPVTLRALGYATP